MNASSRDTPNVWCETSYRKGDERTATSIFGGIITRDIDNSSLGGFTTTVFDTSVESEISAYKNVTGDTDTRARLRLTYPNNGDPYLTGPSTRETPADNEIVTVDYLKKYVADVLAQQQQKQRE